MIRDAVAEIEIRKMNRILSMLMLLGLIGAEVFGFVQWLS